jgi:hypothetical protein
MLLYGGGGIVNILGTNMCICCPGGRDRDDPPTHDQHEMTLVFVQLPDSLFDRSEEHAALLLAHKPARPSSLCGNGLASINVVPNALLPHHELGIIHPGASGWFDMGRQASSDVHHNLLQVLIYLPLSLEVAGKPCFLNLSAALATYYFLQSTLNLLLQGTRLQIITHVFSPFQVIAIPGILLLFLNLYHSPSSAAQVGTFLAHVPGIWETILKGLTPVFELLEGLSTLLVVQALGQVSRYLIEERNESFQFVFLVAAAA